MYYYDFSYGSHEERNGLVIIAWHDDHTIDTDRWRNMEVEAKAIWLSADGRSFFRSVQANQYDQVALLAFADWCAERGLVLNERAAKEIAEALDNEDITDHHIGM